jgi:hypothetical protein
MVENKRKTKTAMLAELESIKGLLIEEDDIPILQETVVRESASSNTSEKKNVAQDATAQPKSTPKTSADKTNAAGPLTPANQIDAFGLPDSATRLMNTLDDLKTITDKKAKPKTTSKHPKTSSAQQKNSKTTPGNPFLPEHIRSRLHGNNPPPLFEFETAKKISDVHRPTTLLGSTRHKLVPKKNTPSYQQQDLITEIMNQMLPELEKALREKLETMSKEMLENLRTGKN